MPFSNSSHGYFTHFEVWKYLVGIENSSTLVNSWFLRTLVPGKSLETWGFYITKALHANTRLPCTRVNSKSCLALIIAPFNLRDFCSMHQVSVIIICLEILLLTFSAYTLEVKNVSLPRPLLNDTTALFWSWDVPIGLQIKEVF